MTVSPPSPDAPRPAADRWLAGTIAVVLGLGGADEFRYFGPDTPQFWAGAVAVAGGAIAVAAAVRLWRRGDRGAESAAEMAAWVRRATGALLVATLVGAALRVMGPPPILLGLLGAAACASWLHRHRAAT